MRDGPRDECGVFGVYAPGYDVSRLAFFALYALQHRGQESAGIAAADRGGYIVTRRDLGLVSHVFNENDIASLGGELAIGHVRYSTTGSNAWENSQPVQRAAGSGGNRRELALAHNGNLINAVELHAELRAEGVEFASTSDSEIIAALIASHEAERVEDAVAAVLPRMQGAFSTVLMTKDRVLAFRDPAGLRPLVIGCVSALDRRRDRALLRRERVVRAGHHRRRVRARRAARRARLDRRARDRVDPGRRGRARGVLRLRVHLLRPARLAHGRHDAPGRARADGRDPRPRGAGRRPTS